MSSKVHESTSPDGLESSLKRAKEYDSVKLVPFLLGPAKFAYKLTSFVRAMDEEYAKDVLQWTRDEVRSFV